MSLQEAVQSPLLWGVVLAAIGLALLFARQSIALQRVGSAVGLAGLVLLALALPGVGTLGPQVVFWMLALLTLVSAAGAVSARAPVYTAVLFAVSLVGVAGLFLLQGADFLGIATIAVYAGAIVVTFLFVLMLAQPEGHERYDQLSWASFSVPAAVIAAAMLAGTIALSTNGFEPREVTGDVLHEEHVAKLGTQLFARHLVAVEVGGTLLLVALVGAVAIVIQGKRRRGEAIEGASGGSS